MEALAVSKSITAMVYIYVGPLCFVLSTISCMYNSHTKRTALYVRLGLETQGKNLPEMFFTQAVIMS